MLAKQRAFEYWDKPTKFLTRHLVKIIEWKKMSTITTKDGIQLNTIEDRLRIFSEFYEELYKSCR